MAQEGGERAAQVVDVEAIVAAGEHELVAADEQELAAAAELLERDQEVRDMADMLRLHAAAAAARGATFVGAAALGPISLNWDPSAILTACACVFLLGLDDTWMVQQIMVPARVRMTLKLKARATAIVLMAYAAGASFPLVALIAPPANGPAKLAVVTVVTAVALSAAGLASSQGKGNCWWTARILLLGSIAAAMAFFVLRFVE